MLNAGCIASVLLASVTTCQGVIFKPQNDFEALSGPNTSIALDLRPFFNNRAFGLSPNDSSFDGQGSMGVLLLIRDY
jgi:alpha-L-fucosidase